MARRLRHHVCGGWYHITTRGMGRRVIFHDDRDREHFLELLGELVTHGVPIQPMRGMRRHRIG